MFQHCSRVFTIPTKSSASATEQRRAWTRLATGIVERARAACGPGSRPAQSALGEHFVHLADVSTPRQTVVVRERYLTTRDHARCARANPAALRCDRAGAGRSRHCRLDPAQLLWRQHRQLADRQGSHDVLPGSGRGGLLSLGGSHAAQGDSELAGTAIEMSLTGLIEVRVHKGGRVEDTILEDLYYPLLET